MRERLAFPSRLLQGLRQLVQLKQATNFPAVNELPCCKLVRKQFWRIDPHQYFLRWNKNTRGWLRITKEGPRWLGKATRALTLTEWRGHYFGECSPFSHPLVSGDFIGSRSFDGLDVVMTEKAQLAHLEHLRTEKRSQCENGMSPTAKAPARHCVQVSCC